MPPTDHRLAHQPPSPPPGDRSTAVRDIPTRTKIGMGGSPAATSGSAFCSAPIAAWTSSTPGGDATNEVAGRAGTAPVVESGSHPGRYDRSRRARALRNTRKPLVGEFTFNGRRSSWSATTSAPGWAVRRSSGRGNPRWREGRASVRQQAQIVARFVAELLAADPGAFVVVTGDFNEFQFGEPLQILKSAGLRT